MANAIKAVSQHSVQMETGAKFNRFPYAENDASTTLNRRYFIFRSWAKFAMTGSKCSSSRTSASGLPVARHRRPDLHGTPVYASARPGDAWGYGPWIHYDGTVSGNSLTSAAVLFTPGLIQPGSFSPKAVKSPMWTC